MCDQMAAQMTANGGGGQSAGARAGSFAWRLERCDRFYRREMGLDVIGKSHLDMTCDVMAHSLLYWTQDLLSRGLLGRVADFRDDVVGGSHRVIAQYGAVSAAKSALESHCRQLAFELAPRGIAVNALCAGVTDTQRCARFPAKK